MTQEYHAQLLPCYTGISLRRDMAHVLPAGAIDLPGGAEARLAQRPAGPAQAVAAPINAGVAVAHADVVPPGGARCIVRAGGLFVSGGAPASSPVLFPLKSAGEPAESEPC